MTCTCTTCAPDPGKECTASHKSFWQQAAGYVADHARIAADWDNLLAELNRVCRESGQASGQNRTAYSAFRSQASALVDGLNAQPPISPDRLLEGIEQLIVTAQSATVPAMREYTSLSKNLDAFSVKYLSYLDGKKEDEGVEGRKVEFEAEYANMRSYIDRLQSTWTVVGEKLAEILSLLRSDTAEKCDIPNYPTIQVDILDAISKFTVLKGDVKCSGTGFCCYGC